MIYLDSAATSLLKPPQVGAAVERAIRRCASPGRGSHAAAMRAADTAFACRQAAAELFSVPGPEQVAFTLNTTHGLNIAIRSLVRPGDRVVVSGYEHNAVMRPLYALGAAVEAARTPVFDRQAALRFFQEHIPGARCAICTHVSNVFGFVLPVEEIAAVCRACGVPFLLDAAQSAGALDVSLSGLGAEFIAMPGHKGLLGPQGTGLLLCRESAEPLLYGGTGSMSASPAMPDFLPDRLEAGTQNICGIAGLREGLRWVAGRGATAVRRQEQRLLRQLAGELARSDEAELFLAEDPDAQAGVLSVRPRHASGEALAEELGKRGVAVRAGLHCAPLAHKTAGTLETGTVRFSFSPFNTPAEISRAAEITKNILKICYKL